jgi:hypothetical protein
LVEGRPLGFLGGGIGGHTSGKSYLTIFTGEIDNTARSLFNHEFADLPAAMEGSQKIRIHHIYPGLLPFHFSSISLLVKFEMSLLRKKPAIPHNKGSHRGIREAVFV